MLFLWSWLPDRANIEHRPSLHNELSQCQLALIRGDVTVNYECSVILHRIDQVDHKRSFFHLGCSLKWNFDSQKEIDNGTFCHARCKTPVARTFSPPRRIIAVERVECCNNWRYTFRMALCEGPHCLSIAKRSLYRRATVNVIWVNTVFCVYDQGTREARLWLFILHFKRLDFNVLLGTVPLKWSYVSFIFEALRLFYRVKQEDVIFCSSFWNFAHFFKVIVLSTQLLRAHNIYHSYIYVYIFISVFGTLDSILSG